MTTQHPSSTMESLDPKILAKIKKCLALAASDNPNEAATALRQAKAMMEKHGVSANQITMSEIGESTTKSHTMSRDKPAAWEVHLASMVGKAFGCKMMVGRSLYRAGYGHANEGSYIYVGLKHQAEIAAYTASVLIRKCKKARANFISENLKGMSFQGRGQKKWTTKMADSFAEGWVLSISRLVTEFANPEGIDEAIQNHIDAVSSGANVPVREQALDRDSRDMQVAAQYGARTAANESLHRPMNKSGDPLMLGN